MLIPVICPQCHQTLQVPEEYAGSMGTCTRCGGRIAVPEGGLSREDILRAQQGESWSLAEEALSASLRPDGVRLGAGMLATEQDRGGGAGASLGRMAVLGCLLLLIAACVLPALVIGYSAETKPPDPARRPVIPSARGMAEDTGRPEAALVYLTDTGGEYHRGDCPKIRGDAVSLTREEAVARGLKPCQTCGG